MEVSTLSNQNDRGQRSSKKKNKKNLHTQSFDRNAEKILDSIETTF